MRRLNHIICSFLFIVLFSSITGCGGGGGGGATPVVVASTSSFPLKAAMSAYVTNIYSDSYTYSGQGLNADRTTYTFSGPVQFSKTASIVGPFEGVNYLKTIESFAGTLNFRNLKSQNVNVISADLTLSAQGNIYYDANFNEVGLNSSVTVGSSTETSYEVNTITSFIPNFVKVGDSGILRTTREYTSSSNTTLKSNETTSFQVNPDTASTALIELKTISRNSDGTTDTSIGVWRIDLSGNLSRVSSSFSSTDGSSTLLTK